MIVLTLSFALAQSVAPAPPMPPQAEAPPIVVTAKRLDATQKLLDACIARNCPPDEEVAAALAHAENQFVDGDYRAARHTLRGTIKRVDRQAKQYPVAVANIWRADARIAAHLGEDDLMRGGQLQAIDALKAGLPGKDDRVLLQRLQIGDAFMKQGKVDMGFARYRLVIDQARELKNLAVEGTAMLRILLVEASLAGLPANALYPTSRYGASDANFRQAKKSAAQLLARSEPELSGFRDAARLIDARLDASKGDMRGIDAIAADFADKKQTQAILLYAPLMKDEGTFFDPARAGLLSNQMFDGQWIDATFLIGGDGRVRDVEVLREGKGLNDAWIKPVLETIAMRRYAPVSLEPDMIGLRRVERYTMTSPWTVAGTGSNIRTRTGRPRLEMLDLTAAPQTSSNGSATSPPSG